MKLMKNITKLQKQQKSKMKKKKSQNGIRVVYYVILVDYGLYIVIYRCNIS